MPHICKTLLIRCMDFRLNNEIGRWTRESDLFRGGFDIISVAGAGKSFADGSEEIKNNFLENIAVSVELHKAEKIIIFHHSDCGAYAKSYNFSSPEEEREKQIEDMKKAKQIILAKYPEVEIFLVWGQLKDGKGKNIEFEVF